MAREVARRESSEARWDEKRLTPVEGFTRRGNKRPVRLSRQAPLRIIRVRADDGHGHVVDFPVTSLTVSNVAPRPTSRSSPRPAGISNEQ